MIARFIFGGPKREQGVVSRSFLGADGVKMLNKL